jgi:hypothetical protein
MFTPITDHAEQAIARLMSQYQDADNFKNLIRGLNVPTQEIEGVLTDLNNKRRLAVATGVQLDLIGTIVGLAREPGDSDDVYRNKLYGQIKINTSQGQPEQAIQTYQLFTGAALVILLEWFPAAISLQSEYFPADQAEVDFLLEILSQVLPAGVRPDSITAFDSTEAFAMDGSLPGLGFGDEDDPSVGESFPLSSIETPSSNLRATM